MCDECLLKEFKWVKAAVLKLGVATLFRVAKYILWVAKVFLSRHFTSYSLEIVAFKGRGNLKIFKKGRDTKKFENPWVKESIETIVFRKSIFY